MVRMTMSRECSEWQKRGILGILSAVQAGSLGASARVPLLCPGGTDAAAVSTWLLLGFVESSMACRSHGSVASCSLRPGAR